MVDAQRDFLLRVLQGNGLAVSLCETLFTISQVWDDLIDGDPVEDDAVNEAFWLALVALPRNDFYRQHFLDLQPLVQAAITDWLTANELEVRDEGAKHLAFVLRDSLTSVVTQCALLVGGYEWMREVTPEIRLFFHDEPLNEYMEGLTRERRTAQG